MRRYLLASLIAGLILALGSPLVVRFVLPDGMRQELMRALCAAMHKPPPENGSIFVFERGDVLLAAGIRIGCGALAMLVLAWLRRQRSVWRAARITAFWLWLCGYLAFPLLLYIVYALHWQVLLLAIGYGFVETNLACHAGAFALTRTKSASAGKKRP